MENENKKLGSEPAFPTQPETIVVGQQSYTYIDEKGNTQIGYNNVYGSKQNPGMNKRFYAACAAMQGMQASMISKESYMAFERGAMDHGCKTVAEYVAKMSFIIADAMLKQENE